MLICKDTIKHYKCFMIVVFIIFATLCFSSIAFSSQITDLINVTKYHNKGFKGQGVKCAIIDSGFDGWRSLSYVKPEHARYFRYDGTNIPLPDNPSGGTHGTGMAQCFHEIAPEAEIYLIDGSSGLTQEMINYFKVENILLASESLNLENYAYNSFLTGDDMLSSVLDTCVNSSITVCTIAGNFANSSCFAHLTRDPSSNKMMFPNGMPNLDVVVSTSDAFFITITSSGFKRLNANYNYIITNTYTGVQVYNGPNVSMSSIVASMGDVLSISVIRNADRVDYLDIIIANFSRGLFRLQNHAEMNKASSVACPGASKKAITVGAILVSDYNKKDVISSVSGWGPIPQDVDGQGNIVVPYTIKPELCAPSEGGATSPTAPRVAGALAVLASAGLCDLSKPDEVKQYLLANHVVKIQPCPNNTFGYGRLYLDAATDPPNPPGPPGPPTPSQDILLCPSPISLSTSRYLKIANFSLDISKLDAKIYNINGELIKSFSILELVDDLNKKMIRWDLRNENGDKVAPGIYFIIIKTDSEKTQIKKFAVQK